VCNFLHRVFLLPVEDEESNAKTNDAITAVMAAFDKIFAKNPELKAAAQKEMKNIVSNEASGKSYSKIDKRKAAASLNNFKAKRAFA
jgi:hypothetical protein